MVNDNEIVSLIAQLANAKKAKDKAWDNLYSSYKQTPEYATYKTAYDEYDDIRRKLKGYGLEI